MNRTDSKMNLASSIEKAEAAVQSSINRFESAMETLAEKVEGTTQKIHHVRDVARDSKEKLMHFKEEVQATFDPLRPYARQVQKYSTKAFVAVKRVPRPYLWLALGVGVWAGYRIYSNRKRMNPEASNRSDFSSEYTSEYPYQ